MIIYPVTYIGTMAFRAFFSLYRHCGFIVSSTEVQGEFLFKTSMQYLYQPLAEAYFSCSNLCTWRTSSQHQAI